MEKNEVKFKTLNVLIWKFKEPSNAILKAPVIDLALAIKENAEKGKPKNLLFIWKIQINSMDESVLNYNSEHLAELNFINDVTFNQMKTMVTYSSLRVIEQYGKRVAEYNFPSELEIEIQDFQINALLKRLKLELLQ